MFKEFSWAHDHLRRWMYSFVQARTMRETPLDGFTQYRGWFTYVYNASSFVVAIGLTFWMVISWMEFSSREDDLDPMLFSGIVATSAGLLLLILTDVNPMKVLQKMHRTMTITLSASTWSGLKNRLILVNLLCASFFGAALLITSIHLLSRSSLFSWSYILTYMFTGIRFGRLFTNGTIGFILKHYDVSINVEIGHRDGAGGLAVVGNYSLRQTSTLLIPLNWLVSWFLVIGWTGYYSNWVGRFVILLLIVLIAALVGLAVPIFYFRHRIICWKKTNGITCHEAEVRRSIVGRQLAAKLRRQRYNKLYDLATLSDWPVSPEALKISLLGIVLPLVLTVVSLISQFTLTALTRAID